MGLLADISGVIIIYNHGLPPSSKSGGSNIMTEDYDDEKHKKEIYEHKRLSKLGFKLIIIGFVCQLTANIFWFIYT